MPRFELYGIVALIVCAVAWGWGEYRGHERYLEGKKEVQTVLDKFVADTKAEGLKSQNDALLKEKLYATQIATATVTRDDALNRLRIAQAAANSGRRASSSNPTASTSLAAVCIPTPTFNAAFQRFGERLDGFIQGTRQLITEGDAASIDAKAVIQAYPKQP